MSENESTSIKKSILQQSFKDIAKHFIKTQKIWSLHSIGLTHLILINNRLLSSFILFTI